MWDVLVVGAGMAGIPAAVCAAPRGARVLLVEATEKVGGKLPRSAGQISAAGARLQNQRGIADSWEDHFREVMAINGGTGDGDIIKMSIEHAAATIDWLEDIGCRFGAEMPVLTYNHDVYRVRRYFWPIDKGPEILTAFNRSIEEQVRKGNLEVRLHTEMKSLESDPSGAVTGITVHNASGKPEVLEARNIVLAAGGYVADRELRVELTPGVPFYSPPMPISSGKVLRLARAFGCKVDGGEDYLCVGLGVLDDPADPMSANLGLRTVPQERAPWEIWVNAAGQRFTREDYPKANHRRRAIMAQPGLKVFIVFDEGIRQNAPNITSYFSDNQLRDAFGRHPSYLAADTIEELASLMDVDPVKLAGAVASYNQAIANDHDPEFGRDSLPRPIDTPPYYAIATVGTGLPSPAGIAVDTQLRALDDDGEAIPNLYAIGEIIGYTRHMGRAYEAGMGNGPTITLARLLGEQILHW